MTPLLRKMTAQEREKAFAKAPGASIEVYFDLVREMEGGVAYALELNGETARSVKVKCNRAARHLGLRLRWAKSAKDAKEVAVELE